jgi:hypothetical protein
LPETISLGVPEIHLRMSRRSSIGIIVLYASYWYSTSIDQKVMRRVKAYDKINHTYMLSVLCHMGFPPKFCNTVKTLYTNAETIVMINGEMSKPFIVTHGVRQGDPLSCLLFNLAIEPLVCLIRNSDLKGVKIPGKDEDLVVSLFADDTTIYLYIN